MIKAQLQLNCIKIMTTINQFKTKSHSYSLVCVNVNPQYVESTL